MNIRKKKTFWAMAAGTVIAACVIAGVFLLGGPAASTSPVASADFSAVAPVALTGDVSNSNLQSEFELDADTAARLEGLPDSERYVALVKELAQDPAFDVTYENGVPVISKPYALKRLIFDGRSVPGQEGETGRTYDEQMDCTVVSFASMHDAAAAFEKSDPDRVSVDAVVYALGVPDEYAGWGISEMKLDEASNALEGGQTSPVTVAIVDSGIDTSQNVFAGKIIDPASRSFVSDETLMDGNGHGTMVSGIIAASTPSSVSLMGLKALNPNGSGSLYDVCSAIRYAADNGADVVNLSLGSDLGFGPRYRNLRTKMDEALAYASDKGCIVIAAASNEGNDMDKVGTYPASSPYVYSVAALKSDGQRADFSNYGSSLDFAAPGEAVTAAGAEVSGTSFAAPHISAFAADLKSLYSEKTSAEIAGTMAGMSRDLGDAGFDVLYGYGEPIFDMAVFEGAQPQVQEMSATETSTSTSGSASSISEPTLTVPSDNELVFSASSVGTPDVYANTSDNGQPGTIEFHNVNSSWPSPSDCQIPAMLDVTVGNALPDSLDDPWRYASNNDKWKFSEFNLMGGDGPEFYSDYMYSGKIMEYKYLNLYYYWMRYPDELTSYAADSDAGTSGTITYNIYGWPGAPSDYNGLDLSSNNTKTETLAVGDLYDYHGLPTSSGTIYDANGLAWNIDVLYNIDPSSQIINNQAASDTYTEPFEFTSATFNVYVRPNMRNANVYGDPTSDDVQAGDTGTITYVDLNVLYGTPRPGDAGAAITTDQYTVGQRYKLLDPKHSDESGWHFIGWRPMYVNTFLDQSNGGNTKNLSMTTKSSAGYVDYSYLPEDMITDQVVVLGYWAYFDSSLTIHKTAEDGTPLKDAVFEVYPEYSSGTDCCSLAKGVGSESTVYPGLDGLSTEVVIDGYNDVYGKTNENGDLVVYYNGGISGFYIQELLPARGYYYEQVDDAAIFGYYASLENMTVSKFASGHLESTVLMATEEFDGSTVNITNADFGVPIIKTDVNGDPIEGVEFKVEMLFDPESWNTQEPEPYNPPANMVSKGGSADPSGDESDEEWVYTYTTTSDAQGHAFLRLDSWLYILAEHGSLPSGGIEKAIREDPEPHQTFPVTYRITEISGPEDVVLDTGCWYIDTYLEFTPHEIDVPYPDTKTKNQLINSKAIGDHDEDSYIDAVYGYTIHSSIRDGEGDEKPIHSARIWAGDDAEYQIIDDMYAPITYSWTTPAPADAVLPAVDKTHFVGSNVTNAIAADPTTSDPTYAFRSWAYDYQVASNLPRAGLNVEGEWKHASALSVAKQTEQGDPLANASFTVTCVMPTPDRSSNDYSYTTTTGADGKLDMAPAMEKLLDGARYITIVENQVPSPYVKATGGWMITPNGDRSSYTIEYFPGDTDNPEFSYIVGNVTGTSFILSNERMKATLTYEWAGDAPSDAVLPAPVTDYVGTNLTDRIAGNPTTQDPSYLFEWWDYDSAEVSSLPVGGTVVRGYWDYAPALSVVLHDTAGQPISGSEFTVTPIGGGRADNSYTTTSGSNGELDMLPALPYVHAGATAIKITQNTKTDPYIKAAGTWTISIPWNTKGASDRAYSISYEFGTGDTLTSYIAGSTGGTDFALLNDKQKATMSYAWAESSPVPADAVLPESVTDYVGTNMSDKVAGWQTSSDPNYAFDGWSHSDDIYNLPVSGTTVYGHWRHVSDLTVVKKNVAGEPLSGVTFTVSYNYGEIIKVKSMKISRPDHYTTTTGADGKLDMSQAMTAMLEENLESITITEDQPAATYVKPSGYWTITPNNDLSSYMITYTSGDSDTPGFSYIAGTTTGTSFSLVNERAKATLSYEWGNTAPSDAVLPDSVTDYVGTNMMSRIAPAPTTNDPNYAFDGWGYDEAAVSSLPEGGTVIAGYWSYAPTLSVVLHNTSGQPIANSQFTVTANGGTRNVMGSYTTTTDGNGTLDMSQAMPYILADADYLTITQNTSTTPYIKAAGTWTITPNWHIKAVLSPGYIISYEFGNGDTLDSYIEGPTSGTSFILLNDTQKATMTYAWAPGSPVPADAVLPPSVTDYVGTNMSDKIADWATTSDPTYMFLGWMLPDEIDSLPVNGLTIYGSWKHVNDLTVVKQNAQGQAIANAAFTVTCDMPEMIRGVNDFSYTTTTGRDGALDMSQAIAKILDGAKKVTITENQIPSPYLKASGTWTITPNKDLSSYTIEYTRGSSDISGFSYISGPTTGNAFILANDKAKATMSYKWGTEAPSDAVLPSAVTDYVGTNMTSRLAAPPTTSDPAYSFIGWSYETSEVESLPANGTVVTGSWQKVLLPEINIKGTDGPLIKQARFRVSAEGTAAGASGSFETSSDDNGKLDLASAFPYLMKGASKLVIVELETDVSHDKALGTWTIVPKTSGTTIESYEIEYARSDGDVDDVEYASANSGTSFTLVNPLRHIQVSFDETDGPEGLPEAVIIDYGTSPELQPLPDTAEWHFVGWYLDKELTQPYDGSPLTADTVLYAKWEPVPVTAGPEPAPAPNNDEDDVASRLRQQQPQAPIASTGDMSALFLLVGIAAIAGFVVVYRLRRRNK